LLGSRVGGQERHHAAHAAARSVERLGAMQTEAVVLLDDEQCQELDAFLVERIYEFNSNATGRSPLGILSRTTT
jgi:hypothetical protein